MCTYLHDVKKKIYREREFIFHIAKTLNKYTTEMQNQEGCQKGTWPIKAGHPYTKIHKKYIMKYIKTI